MRKVITGQAFGPAKEERRRKGQKVREGDQSRRQRKNSPHYLENSCLLRKMKRKTANQLSPTAKYGKRPNERMISRSYRDEHSYN